MWAPDSQDDVKGASQGCLAKVALGPHPEDIWNLEGNTKTQSGYTHTPRAGKIHALRRVFRKTQKKWAELLVFGDSS